MSNKDFLCEIELTLKLLNIENAEKIFAKNVFLSVHVFDKVLRTNIFRSYYPIIIHESLVFKKIFEHVKDPIKLQNHLENFSINIEFRRINYASENSLLVAYMNENLKNFLFPPNGNEFVNDSTETSSFKHSHSRQIELKWMNPSYCKNKSCKLILHFDTSTKFIQSNSALTTEISKPETSEQNKLIGNEKSPKLKSPRAKCQQRPSYQHYTVSSTIRRKKRSESADYVKKSSAENALLHKSTGSKNFAKYETSPKQIQFQSGHQSRKDKWLHSQKKTCSNAKVDENDYFQKEIMSQKYNPKSSSNSPDATHSKVSADTSSSSRSYSGNELHFCNCLGKYSWCYYCHLDRQWNSIMDENEHFQARLEFERRNKWLNWEVERQHQDFRTRWHNEMFKQRLNQIDRSIRSIQRDLQLSKIT